MYMYQHSTSWKGNLQEDVKFYLTWEINFTDLRFYTINDAISVFTSVCLLGGGGGEGGRRATENLY